MKKNKVSTKWKDEYGCDVVWWRIERLKNGVGIFFVT